MTDKIGSKFGRLTVIRRLEDKIYPSGKPSQRWLAQCECGKFTEVLWMRLVAGKTSSCGCLRDESRKRVSRTHGLSKTPAYAVWCAMRARTSNPNNHAFKHYGERGITVCDRWDNSFEAFLEDMGERPTASHSLERIDVNKGYTPDNVRWDTWKVQQRNRRNNRILEIDGQSKCLAEWSDISGLGFSTILRRIKLGWDVKSAVFKKKR